MNKQEFLRTLGQGLKNLPYAEQDKWIDFYCEMIDDRVEEGLSEEEAVAAIGSVEDVIAQILTQTQPEKKETKKRELKPWHWVLLIAGSPVWFSLLVAAASVIFSLMVTAWSVAIAFYAMAVSLIAVGVVSVLLMPVHWYRGDPILGLFYLGAGLLCVGLGIVWFIGTHYMTKGIVWLCKKLFTALFSRKEAAV